MQQSDPNQPAFTGRRGHGGDAEPWLAERHDLHLPHLQPLQRHQSRGSQTSSHAGTGVELPLPPLSGAHFSILLEFVRAALPRPESFSGGESLACSLSFNLVWHRVFSERKDEFCIMFVFVAPNLWYFSKIEVDSAIFKKT